MTTRALSGLLSVLLLLSCGSSPKKRARTHVPDVVEEETRETKEPKQQKKKKLDPERRMTVHLLDVGQGAATLIELPCGAILVDTGGEQNESFDSIPKLQQQLETFFRRRTDLNRTLDVVVITHAHIDHVRGLPMVLSTFNVKTVVDDGRPGDDLVKDQLAALKNAKVTRTSIKNSDIVKKNGFVDDNLDPFACKEMDPQVRVLQSAFDDDPGWGTDDYGHAHFDDENNHSVVLRVDAGNASVLITGDLEEPGINALIKRYEGTRWLDVDVLQVGHHGSANGTTPGLLRATSPQVALIGSGPAARQHSWTAWQYGHPRERVVELLQQAVSLPRSPTQQPVGKGMKRFSPMQIDKAIYATGWDGVVVVDLGFDGEVQVR